MTPILIVALGLLAPPGPVVPDGPTPVALQWSALAATARVSNGLGTAASASAVCLGNSKGMAYLLTANHAVPKGEARVYEFFAKDSYPKSTRSLTDGEVVVRIPDADIALVKISIGIDPLPVVRVAGPGQRPKQYPFAAISVGCPEFSPPLARLEKVMGKTLVRRPDDGIAFFWQMAETPIGGMSGGPLLDAEGRLVGVCSAFQDGKGYFTHLDEVLAGLKRNGYGWLIAPTEPQPAKPNGR